MKPLTPVQTNTSISSNVSAKSTASFKPTKSFQSVLSLKSAYSTETVVPANAGGYGVPLEHLCRLIDAYPSLQSAEIVKTECYTKRIVSVAGVAIVHRYLVLEICRKGKQPIWI